MSPLETWTVIGGSVLLVLGLLELLKILSRTPDWLVAFLFVVSGVLVLYLVSQHMTGGLLQ